MMKWEEINDNNKTWIRCQKFFKDTCIMRKQYNDVKGQMQDSINKITETEWNLYIEAMEARAMQNK